MTVLNDMWMCDQTSAFAAAILVGTDLAVADGAELLKLERATQTISANCVLEHVGFFANSTLSLLKKMPAAYLDPDPEILEHAVPLHDSLIAVNSEIERRYDGSRRMSAVLVDYAVYLLKQEHISITDFIKWLRRSSEPETRSLLKLLLKQLTDGGKVNQKCAEIDRLLDVTRDIAEEARDRVDAVDHLYDEMAEMADDQSMLWWKRICIALRSTLYCWPLMVAGADENHMHGISLPIGLFLSDDKDSKVYFKIVNHKGSKDRHRRYVPQEDGMWTHMEDSKLQWNREWGMAFRIGLQVGKDLWRTQNGRLRFVDEHAAEMKLESSLVVDVGMACAIVDSVFDGLDGAHYRLSGRSAEAYWAQAALALLLPGSEIPLGVVTGCIDSIDGAYKLGPVEGVFKKLEYFNNLGRSRIILPASESQEMDVETDSSDESVLEVPSAETVGEGVISPLTDIEVIASESYRNAGARHEDSLAEREVRAFLESLRDAGEGKTMEINFCLNARSAADAMQISGWRRTAFLRLPDAQRIFLLHLRRLFLKEQVEQGRQLSIGDLKFHRRNPWGASDTFAMEAFDRHLLSETRAIKFVDRELFEEKFSIGAEAAIGKWLAWKDHRVRSNEDGQQRGPGMGILCLRSTKTDNEMRLWSMIADALSASSQWWDQFQWSNREQAAELLAKILGNRRADPTISLTPAPDLLVLFDEGNFTQRRTNNVFPDAFHGQWLDLLNPSRDDAYAPHHLNAALLRQGLGSLGRTRIIVVHGGSTPRAAEWPDTLDLDDKDALERLALFRFGFSKQAAYTMMNYDRPEEQRLEWVEVDQKLSHLLAKRALYRTRGQFYISPRLTSVLCDSSYARDPRANLRAAKALAPILEPGDLFIASNRDRTLEPEPLLEATWHLHKARVLSSPRDFKIRSQCTAALSSLTFLRPFADWDTAKQLQYSTATVADSVELGRELLLKEYSITGCAPHSYRVASLLNAIGDRASGLNGESGEAMRAVLSDEATALCKDTLITLETVSGRDGRRQMRKLFSEYLYCMKALDIPNTDYRLADAARYLNGTIDEIVRPNFYAGLGEEFQGLDDYPLSRDWMKACWEDITQELRNRSKYAYVAARINIGRWRNGELMREPWDQPWIEYFALTTTNDFDARQINTPLRMWQELYGHDSDLARDFGQRILNFSSYKPRKRTDDISWWGKKIEVATDNLWEFINHSDAEKQLRVTQADIALKIIHEMVMSETVPAFDFIERRGMEWLPRWPQRFGPYEWNVLAADVVGSQAGWVSMLSSVGAFDEQSLSLVQSWLRAHGTEDGVELHHHDPDGLLDLRGGTMKLVDTYRRKRAAAIWNGYQLLAQRNQRGWAIYGRLRVVFENILREIDGDSNSWFFSIANRRPDRRAVVGACLMLERHISSPRARKVLAATGLEQFRAQLLRNIPDWIKHAGEKERLVFENLGQQFVAQASSIETERA